MAGQTVSVTIAGGGRGLYSLLTRAQHVDEQVLVRFNQVELPEPASSDAELVPLDVYVTTPFNVFAARRIQGKVSRDGAVVRAADVIDLLAPTIADNPADTPAAAAELPDDQPLASTDEVNAELDTCDALWPGMMPPKAHTFSHVDTVPAAVVTQLADEGKKLARQFSGPLGPPASLMDQIVLEVDGNDEHAEVPMRMVFALTSLGLIPPAAAPASLPKELRVAVKGSWVRIDAAFGSVVRATNVLGL